MHLWLIAVIIFGLIIVGVQVLALVYFLKNGGKNSKVQRNYRYKNISSEQDIFRKLENGTVRKLILKNKAEPYDCKSAVIHYSDSLKNSKFIKESLAREGGKYYG